jgi:2-polyprenyl-6-methoxyphenol hydroxylase-like FAD-dependent oxidoreductase
MAQMKLDYAIIQIGYGPVSKALALFLQRLGWKVEVFERANSFVRESLGIKRQDLGFETDWRVIDFALNGGLTALDLGIPDCGQ